MTCRKNQHRVCDNKLLFVVTTFLFIFIIIYVDVIKAVGVWHLM